MSAVNVTNITVLNNPSSFLSPLKFEITYDCVNALKEGDLISLTSFFPLESCNSSVLVWFFLFDYILSQTWLGFCF